MSEAGPAARAPKDVETTRRRMMTESPVPGLIARLAAPTIASMLVTNLYNAGDAWFVSHVGTSASGAVGIVFALLAMFQAFGFLFGHGAGSNIARRLGAGDAAGARVFASTSFFLALASGALVSLLGFLFLEPLALAFGSTPTILPYAKAYMRWVLVSGPFFTASCAMNNILRYEGRAFYAMIGLLTGSVLNLALDPLFMFVFGWGVAGAGAATALAQLTSFTLLLLMFRGGRTTSVFRLRLVSFRKEFAENILAVGSPSLVRNVLGAAGPVILNHQAAPYGDAAIAAMSIVGRVAFLVSAVSIGVGQGFQPVVGFNYGAGLYRRVRQALWFTMGAGTALAGVLALPCSFAAADVVAWFRDDPDVVAVGAMALRAQALTVILNQPVVCTNMLFQSLGLGGRAALLSSFRNGLFLFPLLLVLPHVWGVRGIAYAQPVADLLAFAASMPFLAHFLRRLPRR